MYGSQYANELKDKLDELHEFARSRMKIASDAMKRKYDIKSNLREFRVGEAVWLFDPTRKVSLNPKLQRPWKGPFKVFEEISDILYAVQQSPRHKTRIVHHGLGARKTGLSPPNIFILTVPRRYFCCGSLLFLLSVFILWFIYYVSDIFCKF